MLNVFSLHNIHMHIHNFPILFMSSHSPNIRVY